jgi:hypothetical protein
MRALMLLGIAGGLAFAGNPAGAQDDVASVATVHFADGTNVALVDWKLSYEFATWKLREPVSTAKAQARPTASLVVGKKSYPVKGDTLSLTHVEADDTARVVSMNLKKVGDLKMEPPAKEIIAPDVDKSLLYQPRSLDLSGNTLSGIERSFCVASLSPLVDCGATKTSRVVKIDFN